MSTIFLDYFAGIGCMSLALIFSVVVSTSGPALQGVDFVRVVDEDIQARLGHGIWGFCNIISGTRSGTHSGSGYSYTFDQNVVERSWTRGLAIHPFVTILIFALAFACSKHAKEAIPATLASLCAAFFARGVIAFILDIPFFAKVNHAAQEISTETHSGHAEPGPAFWLSFVPLIFVLLGGCTTFLRGSQESRGK
ncbi:hypothetical protein DFH06DRAFT_1472820 [Mycena polygramma]|nr:hypothetical protein DFH06DRAFT_1472820 [Mycena polygramma]